MYNFKRSLIGLVGLLLLVGVVALVTPFKGYGHESAPAASVQVQDVRVVNAITTPVPTRDVDARKASDIVTLLFAGSATANVFKRAQATGVLSPSEFIVPADQVLVITDVEWTRLCSNCTAGSNDKITLEVFGANGAHRLVFASVAPVGSNSQAGASESMETGFAVAEGGHVAIGPSFSSGSGSNLTVFLHGYLIPSN
jgi:hypothetical protein